MKIQAVIFDLDGTLLDTLDDLAVAANQALAVAGLAPRPKEDYRMMVGAGARNLMIRAAAAALGTASDTIDESLIVQLLTAFNTAYDRNWSGLTNPYPGILAVLQQLMAQGIKLAVLSNKPDSFTQLITARFFPAGLFSAVSGNRQDWPIKPDPALALEICRQMGVSPAATAMVGDSGSDMQTAVRAGMLPMGVLWGFRSAAEIEAGGARWLAATPAELASQIGAL